MRTELRTHVQTPRGYLCGASSGEKSLAWVEATCARCESRRSGMRRMYVAMARHMLKTRDVVSAGQVAHAVHGSPKLADVLLEVDEALSVGGLRRATFITGGRFSEVTLWRLP